MDESGNPRWCRVNRVLAADAAQIRPGSGRESSLPEFARDGRSSIVAGEGRELPDGHLRLLSDYSRTIVRAGPRRSRATALGE